MSASACARSTSNVCIAMLNLSLLKTHDKYMLFERSRRSRDGHRQTFMARRLTSLSSSVHDSGTNRLCMEAGVS